MSPIASKTLSSLRRTLLMRRGGVSIFVLLAFPVLVACLALALDISLVSYQARQMQTACDASALAGVVELMDRTPLYLGDMEVGTSPLVTQRMFEEQIASARAKAQAYAKQNAIGGRPLELKGNLKNRPEGDLVVGWVDEPQRRDEPLHVWDGQGPINSLLVRGNRWEERGNPVTYWFGRLLGLSGVDLSASARASIDQRVYGLRPNGHVPVPLVPIVIHPQNRGDEQNEAASSDELNRPIDQFAVDDRTGTVVVGADGIHEFVLRIPNAQQGKKSSNASLVKFEYGPPRLVDMQRRIERGCNAIDFEALGGEVVIDGGLELPVVELKRDMPASEVMQSLRLVRGEKRIWLVGDRPNERDACRLFACVAGRVVACMPSDDAGLEIVVQPCLLVSCTALVGSRGPHNLWIGKVSLSE